MPLKVKELPKTERPYEKLKIKGPEQLTNAELLAIIIKSGTKDENSITIAERLLLMTEKLEDLQGFSIQDLRKIKGIGEVKAIQIKAICELSKRMKAKNNEIYFKIKKAQDVAEILMDEMRHEKQEIIKVIMLSTKNVALKIKTVVTGTVNCANVSLRRYIIRACKNAS